MTTRTLIPVRPKVKPKASPNTGDMGVSLAADQARVFKQKASKLHKVRAKVWSEKSPSAKVKVSALPQGRTGRLLTLHSDGMVKINHLTASEVQFPTKDSYLVIKADELDQLIDRRIQARLPQLIEKAQQVSDPFEAARARGASYKRSQLSNAENLTLADAAQRLGVSEKWLNTLRTRHEFYALLDDGRERGFRYPSWQFEAPKDRLSTILKALEQAGVECWGIHAFMTTQSAELAGRTPREIIVDTSASLEDVLRVVERRYAGDQGAQ